MNNKITWTKANAKSSHKYGWRIFYTGLQDATHNLYELHRLDEAQMFDCDETARKFVVTTALSWPNGLHAKALRFLAQESKNEIDSVIRSACGSDQLDMVLHKLNIQL